MTDDRRGEASKHHHQTSTCSSDEHQIMAKGKKQSRGHANKSTTRTAYKQNDNHGGSESKKSLITTTRNLALVCAALSLMLYWNTHSGSWVFDDHIAIVQNQDVKGMAPLSQLLRNDFWGQPLASNGSHKSFRPLTVLSFRINYLLSGGLHATSFHVCNNILNAIAVFAAVWTMFAVLGANHVKSRTLIVASLVYTFHPIHVEAVANTVGRAELLGAVLEFLAFYLHFCSMKSAEKRAKYLLCVLGRSRLCCCSCKGTLSHGVGNLWSQRDCHNLVTKKRIISRFETVSSIHCPLCLASIDWVLPTCGCVSLSTAIVSESNHLSRIIHSCLPTANYRSC